MSEDDVLLQPQAVVDRDCAVCLQKCSYPTQLPCGHIFCFLCVKGVAIQSRRCALCRDEIPADYLDHPVVLEELQPTEDSAETGEYHWYYEGRNGWWKYDDRSNAELEEAFSAGEPQCKLLLAGAVYTIAFESMVQYRSRDPTRRRRVRRDTQTIPAKGIAGIKILDNRTNPVKNEDEESSSNSNHEQMEDGVEASQDSDVEIIQDDAHLHDIVQRISVHKKAGVQSEKNKRACMKRVMDVKEAREVCQDRVKWRSIVSAYPCGTKATINLTNDEEDAVAVPSQVQAQDESDT